MLRSGESILSLVLNSVDEVADKEGTNDKKTLKWDPATEIR